MRLKSARKLFLQSLCLTYFLAFLSSFWQWPVLHSTHGLVPNSSHTEEYFFGLHAMGMTLSLLFSLRLISFNFTFLLPLLYWNLVTSSRSTGAPFFNFQWDNLLIEAGLVGSLWGIRTVDADEHDDEPLQSTLWAIRFLVFKLMFSSGVVKILSKDPVWLEMRALNFHFASQPLPTPLAWYAAQMPQVLLKLGTALTFWIEIPCAVLLLCPFTVPRVLAAGCTALLMVSIALTGNYNFFNLLTLVLLIPCCDTNSFIPWKVQLLPTLGILVGLVYFTMYGMFDLNQGMLLLSPQDVSVGVQMLLPFISVFVLISVCAGMCWDLYQSWRMSIAGFHVSLGLGVLSCFFVTMSLTALLVQFQQADLLPGRVREGFQLYGKEFAFSYGLFRSMTGVGPNGLDVQVPTLTFVALLGDDAKQEKPLHFQYYANPKFVAPHQPRVDWQLWFAALGPQYAVQQKWFSHLVRLIVEQEPLICDHLLMERMEKNTSGIRVDLTFVDFSRNFSFGSPWWAERGKPKTVYQKMALVSKISHKSKSPLLMFWSEKASHLASSLCIVFFSIKFLQMRRM